MTYDESLQLTLAVLQRHVDRPEGIAPRNHIQNDLGLDSLGIMEVVADLEDELAIQIPTEALSGLTTVEDVAQALVVVAARPR